MVRVGTALCRDVPWLIPLHVIYIHEKTHKLRHRNCRMRIVHLEGCLLRKVLQRTVLSQMLLERFLKGCGYEEILLLQTKLLACVVVVVRVKDLCDGAGKILLLDSLVIVTLVEGRQLEIHDCFSIPDAERVDNAVLISNDRNIVGYRADRGIILIDIAVLADRRVVLHTGISAETNLMSVLRSLQLERISVLQPVIRNFFLETVLDLLLEHAVVITDSAAVCMVSASREGLHETCRESSETAVAERRIRLLILKCIQIETELFERIFYALVLTEVQKIVAECTPYQEFHGKVIDDFCAALFETLAGCHPVVNDLRLDNVRNCLIQFLLGGILEVLPVKHLYRIAYLLLKCLLIKSSAFHESSGCFLCQVLIRPFVIGLRTRSAFSFSPRALKLHNCFSV